MRYLISYLLVFLFLSNVAFGQNIKSFTDKFGTQGEIRYSGVFSDTILPKSGRYELRWRDVDSNNLRTYLVRGNLQNHLPHGKWTWEQADWDYTVSAGSTIRPIIQTKGQRISWAGTFNRGIAQDKWIFKLDSINSEGKSNGTFLIIEIHLINGKPGGNISIENTIPGTSFSLKGQCDNEGIAKGIWSYEYINKNGTRVKEIHTHKQGLLLEVQTLMGTTKSTRTFERNVDFLKNKALYDSTAEIRIGDARFEIDEYGEMSAQLLLQQFNTYYLKGWGLDVFPFEFLRDVPAFKQLEYPIQEFERKEIISCRELTDIQFSKVRAYLTGNILIHRSRSAELDVTISYLQATEQRLLMIDSLLNRTEDPFFTYKNRYEQGVLHWIKSINMDNTVRGEIYDSLELKLPIIEPSGGELAIFKEIHSLLEAHQEILDQRYSIVDEVAMLLKREGELKEMEDLMVRRFEELQVRFSEPTGIAAEIYTKWVKGKAQQKLQEYARTDDYNDALDLGNKFLTLEDSLNSWLQRVNEFDSMLVVLHAQYTYLAYNPYTGENDIEVKVKKRLYSNITTNLWPYMLNQMKEETDWMTWGELYNRQFKVYNYLLKFATREDKQAKRLNKRFRKEKKPERLLKAILNHIDDEVWE